MSIDASWFWFALFVFIAFTTEVATGFGSIVIALALGALFLPFAQILPILVTLNAGLNAVLMVKLYRNVDTKLFFATILPLMLVGMVIGVLLFPYLPEYLLKMGFAALIIWFAGRALFQVAGTVARPPRQTLWLLMGGITHGLYASGGPMLVYGLSRLTLDKHTLRATLLATWLALNIAYAIWFAMQGSLWQYRVHIAGLLPVLAGAALCGQWLHNQVDEAQYKRAVFGLLLLCGVIMLGQNVAQVLH